jgi:mRNA interferase RelE/StbE
LKKSKPISLSAAESADDRFFVAIKPSAKKELEALPDIMLDRTVRKIESLAALPRPSGCKKLKGYSNHWRIRIGDWRVVYTIDDLAKMVRVTRIAHRSEVYES